ITGSLEDFEREAANERWHTLYETSPGLPFIENPRSGNPFIGVEIGGRIQTLDEQHLLLSLGDQGFDGWETTLAISQDLSSPFGKTMKIDKQTGEAKLYSMGHRNPQGLCVATDGSVWSTEHGPKGGDELNLIQEGKNYGWPIVTLGANYFDTIWPLSSNQSSHDGYEYPVYSWLPSIGISNLIQVKGSPMPIWRGDLLVSSLAAGTVYHVRLHDGRVLFSEPLDIGKRIRDIAEGANGNVYLWTDSADFVRISPVEMVEKTGETLFAQCLVCHSRNLHGLYAIGPSLEGVFGRKIASLPDFQYTAGMKSVKGRWNSENLDAFIENPQVFAHGTTMVSPHLTSEDRQRLLVYLKSY
ncbi:MAG: PQQ-dependent sugar dehydrogenase, partial [Verrucomicrobiae bacterium]|nr:PQQ-dependent sugar dehydrogenase [Verrucomicrobiae bacterium]